MKDLFTIVLQGQLNETSLKRIREYSKHAKIIISCWNEDDLKLLDNIIFSSDVQDIVINEMFPRWRKSERGYYKYQTTTVYEGLKKVNTKYVIKLRSDECYSNLIPFMENIRNNPNRFTSINVYFRRCVDHPWHTKDCAYPDMHYVDFHVSDHMFGGRTDLLLKTFELMNKSYNDEKFAEQIYFKTAETAFATCFLLANGVKPDFKNVRKQMQDYFSVVMASKLGETHIVNARRHKIFKPEDFEDREKVTYSISFMDEI